MKRKILLIPLVLLLAISLVAIGCAAPTPAPEPVPGPPGAPGAPGAPAPEKISITLAQHNPLPDMQGYKDAERFRALVWQLSDGRIEVNHFPGDLLGDWLVQIQQVREGAIDMAKIPPSASFDPELEFSVVPFVVFDWEGAKAAYQTKGSPAWELTRQICERNNTHMFGITPEGYSIVISAVEFTPMPGDPSITKLKTRVNTKMTEKIAQTIGFRTITMPLSEVHSSLMLGTIDAAFGPTYEEAMMFTDVAPFLYPITFAFSPPPWVMNLDFWNSLTPEAQDIITQAMDQVLERAWIDIIASEGNVKEVLAEKGVTIVPLTDEQMRAIVQKCRGEVWPWAEQELIPKQTMDLLRGFAQAVP